MCSRKHQVQRSWGRQELWMGSKKKKASRRGKQEGEKQVPRAKSYGATALVSSWRVFLGATETKGSGQRNGLTGHDFYSSTWTAYMENEFRRWKLIQRRQCTKKQRLFLLIPLIFLLWCFFFQPWTSMDILGGGRRPSSRVLFPLPSLHPKSQRSLYITVHIGKSSRSRLRGQVS